MVEYKRMLSDLEMKAMEHYLIDPLNWIDKDIQGKINKGLKILGMEERAKLISEGAETVPAKDVDLADSAFKRPDYKNREERELAEIEIIDQQIPIEPIR